MVIKYKILKKLTHLKILNYRSIYKTTKEFKLNQNILPVI